MHVDAVSELLLAAGAGAIARHDVDVDVCFGESFGDFLDAPGKVMGLAPYGTATFPVDQWLTVEDGGLVRFSPEGLREAKRRCRDERDLPARADVAASVQRATEYALINIVHKIRAMSASTNLCYAGGVALNSVANELLVRQSGFEQVYIFPAAEDSGVSVGAAYYGLWQLEHHNTRQRVRHDAMGRIYDGGRIDRAISSTPAVSVRRSSNIASDVARLLCHGEVVGWFDGRSELGPRALGQRTILYDPRRSDGKEILNRRVKHREMFRPFAPVILRDHAQDWFDVAPEEQDSPFMLRVWTFLGSKATLVPAVAHVDNTARVQTITRDVQPLLFDVLSAFFAETGVPLLLNTSYNVAGEPIVETPEDALFCLMSTGIDCCIFDDRIVRKQEGFKSLLDLRPRISAKAIMADLPVVAGCVMASADDAAVAPSPWQDALIPFEPSAMWHVRDAVRSRSGSGSRMAYGLVQTEWGDVAVLIPEQYFRLLTKIDGICDGHALLDTTCGWSEKWLLTALAGLYRASLIRFSCASLSATEGKSTD